MSIMFGSFELAGERSFLVMAGFLAAVAAASASGASRDLSDYIDSATTFTVTITIDAPTGTAIRFAS